MDVSATATMQHTSRALLAVATLGAAALAGCVITKGASEPGAGTSSAGTRPESVVALPVDDLQQRYEEAVALPLDERLRELAAIRTELVHRYLVLRGNGADPTLDSPQVPEYPMRRTWYNDKRLVTRGRSFLAGESFEFDTDGRDGPETQKAAQSLFRSIQWQRALAYAEQGNDAGLVAELAPPRLGGWKINRNCFRAPAMSCPGRNTLCERARAAFDERFPNTCRPARAGGYCCRGSNDSTLAILGERETVAGGAFVDAIASEVTKRGNGWLIRGTTSGPHKTRSCKAQYETDKIIGVTKEYIRLERTRWCVDPHKTTMRGIDVQFEVNHDLPTPPRAGDDIRFFAEDKKLSSQQTGTMHKLRVRDAIVAEMGIPAGYRYRWNQSFDWQLHRPYQAAKIDKRMIRLRIAPKGESLADCMRLLKGGERSGTAVLQFTIKSNGTLTDIGLASGTPDASHCVKQVLKDVKFHGDRDRQPTPVKYPLVYEY